jgi:sec-independent protein translocase protein TatA
MGLFDSPWHVLILLVVVLLLFGAKRLPSSARSLGQAMRIFKAETRGLREEDDHKPAAAAPQQITAGDAAVNSAAATERAPSTNQPG